MPDSEPFAHCCRRRLGTGGALAFAGALRSWAIVAHAALTAVDLRQKLRSIP